MEEEGAKPFLYSSYINGSWLDNALDIGISYKEYWNMTLPELQAMFDSYHRVQKIKAQEQATYDYRLANMIGWSVGRAFNSANKFGPISDYFPELFDSEEIQEQIQVKKDELSAIRFKQFAQSFNKKFLEEKKD